MPTASVQLDFLAPAAIVAAPAPAIALPARWRKSRIDRQQLARVLFALGAHEGWLTRAQLGIDERELRLIAEASNSAVLSYPGSPGYCLFDEAGARAWDACDAAYTAQIEKMRARRNGYRRRRQMVERRKLQFV